MFYKATLVIIFSTLSVFQGRAEYTGFSEQSHSPIDKKAYVCSLKCMYIHHSAKVLHSGLVPFHILKYKKGTVLSLFN